MSNTLGLDDDLDPVEALVSLERAFALKISDAEARSCSTVGNIYDLLQARFAAQIGGPGSCMTSMAFYRLRRALRGRLAGVEFRPDTPLAAYAGRNARAFLRQLRRGSGLRLPQSQGRWLSWVGGFALLLGVPGIAVAALAKGSPIFYLAALGLTVVGVASIWLDPGALPTDCATLGQLATRARALNYGTLARSGGAIRGDELWDAMADVLAEFSDLPKSDMRRDTLLLDQQV